MKPMQRYLINNNTLNITAALAIPSSYKDHPFLRALRHIASGSLDLYLPGGIRLFYFGVRDGKKAHMHFYEWKCLDRLLTSGDLGWGEDYMAGLWETHDLPALMQFVADNAAALGDFSNGNALVKFYCRYKRKIFANSFLRSRENVHKHYDLGNSFYSQWLDQTMTYSCALFGGNASLPLEMAQKAKYARILDRLAPEPNAHILEIGCGWGGFIEEAAARGLRVTGITLSDEQARWAIQRLAAAQLQDFTDIRLEDYREVRGQYDHIVSIGMFEHVGEKFWKTYMGCLHRCLKPGGKALVQSIIVREDLFDFYRESSGFIREHIFPSGMLPTRKRFEAAATKAGLHVEEVFHFGQDYAITLRKWLENFDASLPQIKSLGYDDSFIRKWRFYLTYCAAMFKAERIDVMQVLVSK
jgi:cyclopropane-fatty-acyl-phospholipid synthase